MKKYFLGMLVIFILYAIIIIFPNENISFIGTYTLSIVFDLISLIFLYKLKDKFNDKIYWGLVFSSIMCIGISNAISMITELILGTGQDSYLINIFLTGIPTFLIISTIYTLTRDGGIKDIIESVVRSIALICISIYLIFLIFFSNKQTFTQFTTDEWIMKILLVLDFLLLAILLLSFFKGTNNHIKRKHVIIKVLGVLLYTIGDVICCYLLVTGIFGCGSIVDLFWLLGIMLIILSLWYEVNETEEYNIKEMENLVKSLVIIVNVIGLISLYIIIMLDLSVDKKVFIILFLAIGYAFITKIEVSIQKHNLQEVNLILEEQVEQIKLLNAKLVEGNENLENISKLDYLTRLGNRRAFEFELNNVIEKIKRDEIKGYAISLIDLNRFKSINDNHGHNIGDEVIIEAARRLNKAVSKNCVVVRQGGDEFIVLATYDEKEEEITSLINNIKEHLPGKISISGINLEIEFSMGVSIYPLHGLEAGVLIKKADTAMYTAKQKGSNEVIIYQKSLE